MKNITFLLSLFIFMSCSKNDNNNENSNSATNIDIVTGLYFKEDEFTTPLQLGNPNVFTKIDPSDLLENNPTELTENDPNTFSVPDLVENVAFNIYPNPPINYLLLTSNFGVISDIWIIPAQANKSYKATDFSLILNSNLYSESLIESKATIKANDLSGASHYTLDISDLNSGYYKIFVKNNGKIYWDNFYIFPENNSYDDFQNFIKWWNN